MMKNNSPPLGNMLPSLIWVFICLATGYVSARLQESSLHEWYPLLKKSALTPPDIVFPVVWACLYVMMGISIGLLPRKGLWPRGLLLALFCWQLFLNFSWSIAFFYAKNPAAGLAVIGGLGLSILAYAWAAWSVNRWSSILFFPYIAWVFFAMYLNLYIFLNNT